MTRSEFWNAVSPIARMAVVGLALGGFLVACSSTDEETGSDLPQPRLGTQQYKTPSAKGSGTQPTLGRVVDESTRRRQVIRQLETIFKNPQP